MEPLEFYKAFEEIHPFMLNWLRGSLLMPVFPPADLFGERISNP